jgi:hypothetical protein
MAFMVHHRGRPERECGPRFFGVLHAAENEDGKRHRGIPQLRGLTDARDRKPFAARSRKHTGNACDSVPIGIGFHHSDDAALSGKALGEGVVRDESAEVNARDDRPGKLHRLVYNPSKIGPKSGRRV